MVGDPKPPLFANSSVFSFKASLVDSRSIKEIKLSELQPNSSTILTKTSSKEISKLLAQ